MGVLGARTQTLDWSFLADSVKTESYNPIRSRAGRARFCRQRRRFVLDLEPGEETLVPNGGFLDPICPIHRAVVHDGVED